ncbi:hypothetical protein M3193_13910 [Sporosarcina luteola]|uniref:hypothetical protein n=1 Tax=Sporosarcina luteola TaxID=582850 RepID=UPI00203D23EC|nr:hypothetical protein [Sporosarcina luteola]MCM3745230.1 hypothetical protein [Sporosarcina luteola]
MDIKIQPTQQQLDHWIEKYVPEKDLFFLQESDFSLFQKDLAGTLVFPKEEFFKHSSYNGIQMVNSYMYWMISKGAELVIVAQPEWITSLSDETRNALFAFQYELGRGLVGPLSLLPGLDSFPKDYILELNGEKLGVLQRKMWMELPTSLKEEIVCKTAQLYDEWTSLQPPATTTPSHLINYANTFSTEPGANCLAATLFAISSKPELDEWIIHEWIHGDTFMRKLTLASFTKVEDRFTAGDAVVWIDDNNNVQHAAYCIDGQLFFNKNGQTYFNPWKIVEWTELDEEWKRYKPCVYRKKS